jgi:hypothetical protein
MKVAVAISQVSHIKENKFALNLLLAATPKVNRKGENRQPSVLYLTLPEALV